jgi:succinate dehydrogenase / fumarate reductase membrane anchor subunit
MITLINSGWKSGLQDWILQRFTAIYIFLYLLFFSCYLFSFDKIDYHIWSVLFNSFLLKISTLVFIFSLVLHASIGINIILTDYVKQSYLRIILDFSVNIILLSYIFCIMQILWSVK